MLGMCVFQNSKSSFFAFTSAAGGSKRPSCTGGFGFSDTRAYPEMGRSQGTVCAQMHSSKSIRGEPLRSAFLRKKPLNPLRAFASPVNMSSTLALEICHIRQRRKGLSELCPLNFQIE